jgi:hypothetical protein
VAKSHRKLSTARVATFCPVGVCVTRCEHRKSLRPPARGFRAVWDRRWARGLCITRRVAGRGSLARRRWSVGRWVAGQEAVVGGSRVAGQAAGRQGDGRRPPGRRPQAARATAAGRQIGPGPPDIGSKSRGYGSKLTHHANAAPVLYTVARAMFLSNIHQEI